MSDPPKLITIPHAARLLAINPATAWQHAHAGKYGSLTRRGRRQLVDVAQLEAKLGQKFTAEQLQVTRPRPYRAKEDPAIPPLDPTHIHLITQSRDRQWLALLAERGISNVALDALPISYDTLRGSQLYTRAHVREIVSFAREQRDYEWREWLSDASERALHPSGPPISKIKGE